jgi:ABC-type glycerol-3-phosphate transport system substrate-binding protein
MSTEPTSARRTLPRLAAAATVTAALVAGGAATGSVHPSSSDDVQAIINAWPKKYTGVSLVVDPPADQVTDG